jgi:hypothetical protein
VVIPDALTAGRLYAFCDWPNPAVPRVAAGVYTIWRGEELVYVGMSGRSLTSDKIAEHRAASEKGKGLYTRLNSHAGGRRSGDQFCVYVADRLVLPALTSDQIARIASGSLSLDALVRTFIHLHLAYRFSEAPDGSTARQWESAMRRGVLGSAPPLLNPAAR